MYDYSSKLYLHNYRYLLLVLGNIISFGKAIAFIQAAYSFSFRHPGFDEYRLWFAAENTQGMAFADSWHYLLGNLEHNAGLRVGLLFYKWR
ncbi:hypothetical protein FDUTEX481_05669 [Tolypothrix sp. PCC 7601]|nr:hypothetical protein FDUTEX481_05669 [Tolypothrix sp. PCC 7601]BAY94431.1 hypothetical protein NIES3275_64790 [Microchaete diplosiphon NIES-3275]